LQNIVQSFKKVKRQHYCRLIDKPDNKIKTTWNIIKHESGKLQWKEQIPPVLINNENLIIHKTCRCFTTLFFKITENLDLCHEARDNAISFLKSAFPKTFPDFKIILTTESEIKFITPSLKKKKKTLYRSWWNNQ
jgi:hypothetical protein